MDGGTGEEQRDQRGLGGLPDMLLLYRSTGWKRMQDLAPNYLGQLTGFKDRLAGESLRMLFAFGFLLAVTCCLYHRL